MKRAFSLIELIVVVAIIALLTVVTVIGFSAQQKRAREARRLADLGSIGLAIENYRTVNGNYPSGQATAYGVAIATPLTVLVDGGFLNVLPQEPKPVSGGGQVFCQSYTYATDWSRQTLFNGTLDDSHRAYALIARSETSGNADGKHPQDSSIYTTSGQNYCGDGSNVSFLLGPKS